MNPIHKLILAVDIATLTLLAVYIIGQMVLDHLRFPLSLSRKVAKPYSNPNLIHLRLANGAYLDVMTEDADKWVRAGATLHQGSIVDVGSTQACGAVLHATIPPTIAETAQHIATRVQRNLATAPNGWSHVDTSTDEKG